MKTTAELEQDIVDITLKIHKEFPELSKYITEMPDNYSGKNANQITQKNFKEYYNSLQEVLLEYTKTHNPKNVTNSSKTIQPEKFLTYTPSEDIYVQEKEEQDINPEDISKKKVPNKKELNETRLGDDLDVPGSELDDQQESIGSEDEENNYYSSGEDYLNDLKEDR